MIPKSDQTIVSAPSTKMFFFYLGSSCHYFSLHNKMQNTKLFLKSNYICKILQILYNSTLFNTKSIFFQSSHFERTTSSSSSSIKADISNQQQRSNKESGDREYILFKNLPISVSNMLPRCLHTTCSISTPTQAIPI